MRIRKNLLHKCAICVVSQNPWNVLSSSELSENLQSIEANERFFRDATPRKASWERKRLPTIPTEPAPSTEKVVKRPRDLKRKRQEAGANSDDIYEYYTGFSQKLKKRRGAIQSCTEAGLGCNVGQKEDQNDDDEKPLKERSMKSLLAGFAQVLVRDCKRKKFGPRTIDAIFLLYGDSKQL